jgi:hypothetical protein
MRQLTSRVLVLLVMVGMLVFMGTSKSQAVVNASCPQDCYNLYSACLGQGQGDFFWCCAAYNECLAENCGTGPRCYLPEPYPSK